MGLFHDLWLWMLFVLVIQRPMVLSASLFSNSSVINESTLITSTIDASESAPNEANSTPSRSRKTRDPAAISSSSLLAVSTMAVTGVSTFGNGLPETIPESQKAFCTSSISADYSSWMSSNFGKMTTKPYTAYDIVTWPGENSFSITSVSVTDTVYQTWMPDRVSECFCDLCYVGAEYVQLLAWPPSPTTKRAEPPITSFVSEGYTFVSPTVYLKLYDVTPADQCYYRGKTMESAILPWPTESIRARLGDTVAPLLNLQALRTDCSGNYTHEVTTVEGTSYTWDACYPSLVLTGSISTQFPGWGGCSLINNIFDPPMYLTPGPNLPANPAPSNGPAPGPPAQTTSGMKLSTREPLSYRPTPSPPQPVVDSSPEATNGPKYQGGFPNVNGQTSGELPSSTGSEGNSDSSAPYDQSNPQLPSSGGDAQSSPSNDPAANDDGSTRNGGTIPNNTPGFSGDAAPSGGSSSSNPGALNNDNPNLGDFMMSIIRNIPGSGVPTNSAGNGYAGGSINQAAPTIPTSPNGTTGQPSGIVLATNAGFKLDTSLYAMLSLLAGTFCVFLL